MGPSNSVYLWPRVRIVLPFHRPGACFHSSVSFPYDSTFCVSDATAEYATASPTKWAVLTGRPAAMIGAAKSGGKRPVMVAAGATAFMVMPVPRRDERIARM